MPALALVTHATSRSTGAQEGDGAVRDDLVLPVEEPAVEPHRTTQVQRRKFRPAETAMSPTNVAPA